MKKKVLLLNPPGKKGVIRDYYCSHLAKGNYMWPPLDLLILSGHLHSSCEIVFLDAIIKKCTPEQTLHFIKKTKPDLIISLIAAVSWRSDISFFKKLKSAFPIKIIVSGDFPRSYPQKTLTENSCIDAIILNFTECDIVNYIHNDNKNHDYLNIFTHKGSEVTTQSDNSKDGIFSYPIPRHEIIETKRYHLHHLQQHPFTTLLTTFGCLNRCIFCPFERIAFKKRNLSNIEKELLHIKSLSIKELLFMDQSFGSHPRHAHSVCNIIKKTNYPFSWSCEMRVDAANEELLSKMKSAGCHTIMLGVESAREEVLKSHRKGITITQIKNAFHLAKSLGIRTLAHVMMGMNGEDACSQEELIHFSLELDPNYVSFNIAEPLWDTSFREQMQRKNKIFNQKMEVDSSYEYPVWESEKLSAEKVSQLHKKAFRRFYFRPRYLIREFIRAKSHYRRLMMLKEAFNKMD